MHSTERNIDLDSNGDFSITPTKKRMKQTKISSYLFKQQSEACRQSTATSELKSVDNEKPSTSRKILDNSNLQSASPLNLKRKSVANSELQSSSKIQRIAPHDTSPNFSHCADPANTSSVRTTQVRGNDEEMIGTTNFNDGRRYAAAGLKHTLHGDIYQLKHLTLVLIHARKMGYSFRLATEMKAAEKFDDLVLEYEDNTDKKVHRFVQLKHKQDGTQSIKASDLLADIDGAFSVKKYFNSWGRIKKHPDFSGSMLKDFILCTNIGLDIDGLEEARISVSKVTEPDEFLKVEGSKKPQRRYKLKADEHSKLYDKLTTASDLYPLAQKLAQCVLEKKTLDLRTPIFKQYHIALAQEVIDTGKKKFSDKFINDNLSPTARKFRNMLIVQLFSAKDVSKDVIRKDLEKREFQFSGKFGSDSESANESEQNQITKLPDDDHATDAEILEFFGNFVIAVDQPDEVELGEIINREIGRDTMFNLLDAKLVGDSFQNDILNWFKNKCGVFLDKKDVDILFAELEAKVSSPMTTGLNLEYLEILEKYNIEFERQNIDLLKFLDNSAPPRKPILRLVTSERSLLTALRVHQTLKQRKEYRPSDSFIFLRLNKLLLPGITKIVLCAFENSLNQNLLVIDCGSKSAELYTHELWAQLCKAMAKNVAKRMILITQGNNDPPVEFESGCEISRVEDDDIKIDNLKKCSLQKLLEKRFVKFQGQEERTSFGSLLGIRDFEDIGKETLTKLSRIIKVDTLVKLIRDEEVRIGRKVKGSEEIEHYYIPRTIVAHGVRTDGRRKDGRDILNEDEFAARNEQGKIFVLSDAAGMGKSTVLTHLAIKIKQKEPCTLVIRIDLTRNTNVLNGELNERSFGSNDTNKAVDFLVDKLASIQTDLESQVFKTLVKDQGNAVLLFDGFDEITPTYTDIVIDLLQALAKLQIKKLFLTTRSYAYKELKEQEEEGRFCLALYNLQPFSVENQTEFLIKFWKRVCIQNNLDEWTEECLQNHARDVIHLLSRSINDRMNVFTGIPLQTRLVAENFQYPSELPERLNVIDLYRGFAKKKYDIYCTEKKGVDPTKPAAIRDLAAEYDRFLLTHQKFALDALFHENDVKTLLLSQPEIKYHLKISQKIIDGEKLTGIVIQYIEGKPYFVHRTFAEYFAAEFLFNTLEDDTGNQDIRKILLDKVFINAEYRTVRSFLDRLLPDESNEPKEEPWHEILREKRDCVNVKRGNVTWETVYHITAGEGNINIMRLLVNCLRPALLDIEDSNGRTPLHVAACENQNLGMVKHLVENGADINSHDKCGRTVLHAATRDGANLDVVKYLVEYGADINSLDKDGKTVLHDAAVAGHEMEARTYLIESSDDMNSPNEDGRGVLHDATGNMAHLDVVQYLVENGAGINSLDKDGRTVLHAATRDGANLDVVKYLVEHGVDINSLDKDGRTVLHDATRYRANLDVVQYLVENGADINSCDKSHRTVLHYAAHIFLNLDVVKYLVEHGADVNSLDKNRRSVLHDVTRNRANLDVVQYLVENGADINSIDKYGRTVWHNVARDFRNLDAVKYLVEHGANINSLDEEGRTVLHKAAVAKNGLDVMKYLVESGADIDSLDKNGRTVLYYAARGFQNLDMVKYLVEHGANINSLDEEGRTVLHNAVLVGRELDAMKYLVEIGADINSPDKDGRTVLHYAACHSVNLDVVRYLVGVGSDINSPDKDRRTVLHNVARAAEQLKVLQYLVGSGADINSLDKNGRTPSDYTFANHYLNLVKHLVKNGADINCVDKYGGTVLHYAARTGDNLDVVKYLVESGADISSLDKNGRTALHSAACNSANLDVVQYLVESGAGINSLDEKGMTVLHYAARTGANLAVMKYLVKSGGDISSLDKNGGTVLHFAACNSANLDVVRYLVESGAGINSLDKDGRTVLYDAARTGANLDVVKYLVESGADISSVDKNGGTVLHFAACNSANLDVVQYLVESGADINSLDKDGRTVLHIVARTWHDWDVVKYLLEQGADINSRDKNGNTVLGYKVYENPDWDKIKYLLEKGADINSLGKDGRSVLHVAATTGANLDVVKYLLKKGADIKSLDKDRRTVLHNAARSGADLDVLKYLVENGADINSIDENGRTVLHFAASNSANLDVVKYLVESGAGIKSLDKDGMTVLHYAALTAANLDVVRYLVESGADTSSLDKNGRTALHSAACNSANLDVVQYLVESGAGINSLDKYGRTVLHYAARTAANPDVVKYLVESGANINSLDNDGRTVLHYARIFNYLDVVKYLSENGAGAFKSDVTSSGSSPTYQ